MAGGRGAGLPSALPRRLLPEAKRVAGRAEGDTQTPRGLGKVALPRYPCCVRCRVTYQLFRPAKANWVRGEG